jgi:hypothetical protein
MTRLRVLLCALIFAPLLVLADPQTAEEWSKEGEKLYNLGQFEKAAEAFKEAYGKDQKPAYLFNVAQAYRYGNKCREAAFFYKRYLGIRDQDTAKPLAADKRQQIEGFITQLEECAKSQDSLHPTPEGSGAGSATPEGSDTAAGSGSGGRVAVNGSDDGSDDDDNVHGAVTVEGPKVLTARFTGGAAKVTAGGLDVPIQASFAMVVGYPVMKSPKLIVDAGVAAGFTPVKFTNVFSDESQTGSMTQLLANVGASYGVAPKIALRGDVGAGVLLFGGIDQMGSPFTEAGAPTSGALAMFALRVAASADYLISPNLFITATPFAFSYSPPKKGMREDIKSLTQIDFMVGLGYRM